MKEGFDHVIISERIRKGSYKNHVVTSATLHKQGLDMGGVAAVYLYVADMAQFHRINAVYKSYFSLNPPIR